MLRLLLAFLFMFATTVQSGSAPAAESPWRVGTWKTAQTIQPFFYERLAGRPDGKLIWSYREAMVPPALPRKLIVMGSGAIGSEFASFYLNMGSEVTLIEVMDRILPVEDAEISAFVQKSFAKQGMKIITGAKVQGVRKAGDALTAIVEADGKVSEIAADRLISAVGIVGNVENLGLEGTKVQVDRTHVLTDAMGRTGEPGVHAMGDLTGPPWLAHKASHEGIICVEAIAGLHPHPDRQAGGAGDHAPVDDRPADG